MKPAILAIAGLLGSCATTAATTLPAAATTVPVATPPMQVSAGCNVTAALHCDGPACDADETLRARPLETREGAISYYADSLHGRRTASGERYDRTALTAASRTLPFGAIVRIQRVDDPSRSVVVRINDRGPFGRGGRILDVSRAAAECLDMIRRGVVTVRAEVVDWGPRGRPSR